MDGGGQIANDYDNQNFEHVFTGVPVHLKRVFMGVPKFETSFHGSKWSPCYSKHLSGKLIDLEIQIF